MFNIEDVDITKYDLISPESIEIVNEESKMFDITVEDDNTFFLKLHNRLNLQKNCDGNHIQGLLITFFYKYAKELFNAGKIKMLKTPIIVANTKGKKKDYVQHFFNLDDYQIFFKEHGDKYEYSYKKGLGSWEGKDLQDIIKIVGIKNMLVPFELTEETEEIINNWMSSKTAEKRKEYIMANDFDLFKV